MIGRQITHYRFLEKLGEGGMGEVYLAEDQKLQRKVAIKYLPEHISKNPEDKIRFMNEARTAASLNHQNISTIYSVEEFDDQIFIVMEYIEGIELKEKLLNSKIPLNEVIEISKKILDGLKTAHLNGIIHKDIKSSNIMLSESGLVKIMDFGLAEVKGTCDIFAVHNNGGTAAYMSPEQLKDELIDERTDIWSFGIILYEMLCGKMPFTGDYEQAVSYSIVNEQPEPLENQECEIPDDISKIVEKCLEKDVSKRYSSVSEVLDDFDKLNKKTSVVDKLKINFIANSKKIKESKKYKLIKITSFILFSIIIISTIIFFAAKTNSNYKNQNELLNRIAVIPFTNINNDKELDFLSFALADQIINSLAYINEILVRPSSAIRPFQNEVVSPEEMGRLLNVDYILSGSYLKISDEMRLNLELVDIKTNKLIWFDNVKIKYDNAFKLQDIISEKVLVGLQLNFALKNTNKTVISVAKDPVAYEYYLRAVSHSTNIDENEIAIALLNKSIELDSSYSPSFAELGYRYQIVSTYNPSKRVAWTKAERAYSKALSMNNKSLQALSGLASLKTEIGKTAEAINLLKQAITINPNNAEVQFWLGYVYRYTGLLDSSIERMEKALQLDPGNSRFRSIGITYIYANQFEKALTGFDLDKNSTFSKAYTGKLYMYKNMYDLAKEKFNEVLQTDPESSLGLWSKVMLNYIEGNYKEGLKILKYIESSNAYDSEQIYNYASLYALYNKKADCIRLLNKAIENGFYCYPFMLIDPFLDSLRNTPEFQTVMNKAQTKYSEFKRKNNLINLHANLIHKKIGL